MEHLFKRALRKQYGYGGEVPKFQCLAFHQLARNADAIMWPNELGLPLGESNALASASFQSGDNAEVTQPLPRCSQWRNLRKVLKALSCSYNIIRTFLSGHPDESLPLLGCQMFFFSLGCLYYPHGRQPTAIEHRRGTEGTSRSKKMEWMKVLSKDFCRFSRASQLGICIF